MEDMPAADRDPELPADDAPAAASSPAPGALPAGDDASAAGPGESAEEPRDVPARLQRQARIGRFLALGAALGVVIALAATFLWPQDADFVPSNPELEFTKLQVFGFLLVYITPIAIGLAGLAGVWLGHLAAKRSSTEVTLRRQPPASE